VGSGCVLSLKESVRTSKIADIVLRDKSWARAFEQQFTLIWNQATP
jgi:hypothetical protein